MDEPRKGPIVIYADMEAGRLASGFETDAALEPAVAVTCHTCGRVTCFPVHRGRERKPGPCAHCGVTI